MVSQASSKKFKVGTVGEIQKVIEIDAKSIALIHIYMTVHVPVLVPALNKEWRC